VRIAGVFIEFNEGFLILGSDRDPLPKDTQN